MVQKYEKLENALNEFNFAKDRLDEYEKKIQLMGTEILATKKLYDEFIKNKPSFSKPNIETKEKNGSSKK